LLNTKYDKKTLHFSETQPTNVDPNELATLEAKNLEDVNKSYVTNLDFTKVPTLVIETTSLQGYHQVFDTESHQGDLLDHHDRSDKETEKHHAQISAAKRSIVTNVVLGSLFIFLLGVIMLVPPTWRPYCFAIIFSFIKVAMPVLTTISNFGTVQFVLSQYWNSFYNQFIQQD
jgi:hypothetical protein